MNGKPSVAIKDIFKFKFISNFKTNFSKTYAAFIVSNADEKKNNYVSNLWIMDLKNHKLEQVTNFGRENMFFWYSDSKIVFSSSLQNNLKNKSAIEKTSFFITDILEKKIEIFFELNYLVMKIERIDDDNFAFIGLKKVSNLNNQDVENKFKNFNNEQENSNDVFITEKIPIWFNGFNDFSSKIPQLFIFNKKNNNIKQLSKSTQFADSFIINNNHILYTVSNNENVLSETQSLYLYNFLTDDTKCIVPLNKYIIKYANFLNKDKLILIMTDGKNYGNNQNPDFYIYKINGIFPEKIIFNNTSCTNSVVSDCRYGDNKEIRVYDNKLYFLTTVGSSSNIMYLNELGEIKQLTNIDGSIETFDFDNEKNLYYIAFDKHKLQEIYLMKNDSVNQLTFFNDAYEKEVVASKPLKISVSKKNIKIDGFIYFPFKYTTKKYPGVLLIHGGPKSVYGNIFNHEIQVLTSKGYFVFCCNHRGSDGKGNQFADIRGKYGLIDFEDIMDFTNYVVNNYKNSLYKSKIAVMGGSYGGYMTNWIIGHTNFFKTAISLRGISSWVSMHGLSDAGYLFVEDQCKTNIWNDLDKIISSSPITYANKVKTPTLFIHSEKDYRCHYIESLQMYTALKKFNVKTKFVLFKNENHNLSRTGKPLNRIKRLEIICDWLKNNLD
ncbi:MAG: S9 family peptidase [Mycoplasma sp.]|nr:S9 family peptidase [Mycoplasma sp.]